MSEDERRNDIDGSLRRNWGWAPYRALGGAAIASCAFVALCDVLMWFLVDDYNPLAQTISELGAGPYHEIQDAGIVVFAFGVFALLGGLVLRGRGEGARPWIVRGLFAGLAIDIVLIGLWNEYGDGDRGGPVIHQYLVAILYVLVPAIFWLGASVAPTGGEKLARLGRLAALAWLPLAPLFYVVPNEVQGLYERALASVMVAAVAIAGWRLYQTPADEG